MKKLLLAILLLLTPAYADNGIYIQHTYAYTINSKPIMLRASTDMPLKSYENLNRAAVLCRAISTDGSLALWESTKPQEIAANNKTSGKWLFVQDVYGNIWFIGSPKTIVECIYGWQTLIS